MKPPSAAAHRHRDAGDVARGTVAVDGLHAQHVPTHLEEL